MKNNKMRCLVNKLTRNIFQKIKLRLFGNNNIYKTYKNTQEKIKKIKIKLCLKKIIN
jgi:hypothetical protein